MLFLSSVLHDSEENVIRLIRQKFSLCAEFLHTRWTQSLQSSPLFFLLSSPFVYFAFVTLQKKCFASMLRVGGRGAGGHVIDPRDFVKVRSKIYAF